MPIPIPKLASIGDTSKDNHYMSFEEAQLLPFTVEHQPSLKATTLRFVDDAKTRDAVARSKLGAARVATSLSNNITKLKNKT